MLNLARNWFGKCRHRIVRSWWNQCCQDLRLWWYGRVARKRTTMTVCFWRAHLTLENVRSFDVFFSLDLLLSWHRRHYLVFDFSSIGSLEKWCSYVNQALHSPQRLSSNYWQRQQNVVIEFDPRRFRQGSWILAANRYPSWWFHTKLSRIESESLILRAAKKTSASKGQREISSLQNRTIHTATYLLSPHRVAEKRTCEKCSLHLSPLVVVVVSFSTDPFEEWQEEKNDVSNARLPLGQAEGTTVQPLATRVYRDKRNYVIHIGPILICVQ